MEKNIVVCKECGREVKGNKSNKMEMMKKHLKNNHLELYHRVDNEEEVNNEEN